MSDADQTLQELERSDLGLPAGLELEWLGVSGYRMTYEGTTIFIDPYVSRVKLRAVLLRRAAMPDAQMIDRYIVPHGEVAGVLVGHTHFDHAVDAPEIARRYGCKAYGSESLRRLMELHGLGEQTVVVEPYERYELGPFVVKFVPSTHSKLILGRKVLWDGELTCEQLDGLSPGAYKCGQVWGIRIEVAGVSFYHQGSADLIDDALPDEPVDYFLAGRRRPQRHAALLAAHPAEARPEGDRADPLRQLLQAAWAKSRRWSRSVKFDELPRGDRRGQPRRTTGGLPRVDESRRRSAKTRPRAARRESCSRDTRARCAAAS